MQKETVSLTGGCLCGALRYELRGSAQYQGLCYCCDCRKASGSGFIPFMGFAADQVTFTGAAHRFVSPSARGGDAVRNSCPECMSLVFGGILGVDTSHTIYAGTLDDPSQFSPRIAIFARSRPSWAPLPEGLKVFDALPE